MTHWQVIHGDILDVKADGLICSANPHLNLSGGVGGAILLRYGNDMQTYLHEHLKNENKHYVDPCTVVLTPSFGTGFKAVAHAVAIDGFYQTSVDRIVQTYQIAFVQLAGIGCRTIAATCLGCGFGRCPISEFLQAVDRLQVLNLGVIESVTFATTDSILADELANDLVR